MCATMSKHAISHIQLDVVGGIAGDMFAAACVDAFPYLEDIILKKLYNVLPKNIGTPIFWQALSGGFSAKRFELRVNAGGKKSTYTEHVHKKNNIDNVKTHHHNETTFVALKTRIASSYLLDNEKKIAISILTLIAEAEAKMHASTLNEVHFHELADWDSLMDVIVAAIIIHALNFKSVSISTLPLGGGRVNSQHGLIPVPAPATSELLQGFEFFDDGIQGERITPTGAAILRYLTENFSKKSADVFTLTNNGYGSGSKVLIGTPNILRVMAYQVENEEHFSEVEFHTLAPSVIQKDYICAIEFDIDDMTPEELAVSIEYLRDEPGVIDLVVKTARGKKSRSIELINILASPEKMETVIAACFEQTSTLGVRHHMFERAVLTRKQIAKPINSGKEHCGVNETILVKRAVRPSGAISEKVEADELAKISTFAQRRRLQKQSEDYEICGPSVCDNKEDD